MPGSIYISEKELLQMKGAMMNAIAVIDTKLQGSVDYGGVSTPPPRKGNVRQTVKQSREAFYKGKLQKSKK